MHTSLRLCYMRKLLLKYADPKVTCSRLKHLQLNARTDRLCGSALRAKFHHKSQLCSPLVSFNLSDIGEGIKEVEVLEWFVSEGDSVAQFDSICEVQSDKASVTITSRYDGVIKKLHHNIGDVAQVGQALVDIETDEDGDSEPDSVESTSSAPEKSPILSSTTVEEQQLSTKSAKALATPAVRHMAKSHNLDIADIAGSGQDGRVLKEDILAHVTPPQVAVDHPPPSPAQPISADRVERLKGIRKAMMTSMTSSLSIPHFGYDDEYDMTELGAVRQRLKHDAKRATGGVKLSYMPFIVKATSLALGEFPILNSQLDAAAESVIYKADHNIGVAVDTPHGLLVPCVKRVQDMSILDVAVELNRLQRAGNDNRLSPSDLAGGTFSLSNIGSIGGTYARPVIFPPQVAIGALGRIQLLPRFDREGELKRASIMCVSWSADHRVIEGATMARFSNLLRDFLLQPDRMLLHLK